MAEEPVGVVINFFTRLMVAAIEVTRGSIRKGDVLRYKGHTTDFTDTVNSMEVEKQPIEEAREGDVIGLKVKERVRENDKVYRVVEEDQ